MPSTFVHGLLPPSCLLNSKKALPSLTRSEWIKFLLFGMVMANAPDLDIIPASLFPDQWQEIHRSWGHNLGSLTLWVSLGAWALPKWVTAKLQDRRWLIPLLLVGSHVFLDSMQDYDHFGVVRGVPLLWPFSSAEFSLPFRLFHVIELDPHRHFLIAHVLSYEFWHQAFLYEIYNSIILFGLWTVSFRMCFWMAKRYEEKKAAGGQSPTLTAEQLKTHQSSATASLKKEISGNAFPGKPSVPQSSQELPSPLLQDDPQTRISAGS